MRIRHSRLALWAALMGIGALATIGSIPVAGQSLPTTPRADYWNKFDELKRNNCIALGGMSPEGLFDPIRRPNLNLMPEPTENSLAQSPIELSTTRKVNTGLPNIVFTYEPTVTTGSDLALVNNGHTVELLLDPAQYATGKEGREAGVTVPPPLRTIVLNKVTYTLSNLHFHHPSEHEVDGKSFDMELHIVHEATLPARAVIAVFLKAGDTENATLAPLFAKMASVKGDGQKAVVTLNGVNLKAILPSDMTYFGYRGSLTTPPCDYGVTWIVLKTPIDISKAQLAQFKEAIKYGGTPRAGFPVNARNLQFPGYHSVSPAYLKN